MGATEKVKEVIRHDAFGLFDKDTEGALIGGCFGAVYEEEEEEW